MKNVQLRNSFLLLLTAFIWGTSFVAQSVGTDYVQPFTFNGIRSLIGSLVLLPCIAFLDRKTSSPPKSRLIKAILSQISSTDDMLCVEKMIVCPASLSSRISFFSNSAFNIQLSAKLVLSLPATSLSFLSSACF